MKPNLRYLCALLLALVCVPAFAAGDCATIQSLGAGDVQTGETVTIEWSYQGNAVPQSQTLSGHDFAEAVVLPPGETSYTYTATKPGEKHVQLSAVTACGTVVRSAKYHVKQCNIVEPIVTIDQTRVAPGGAIHASIDLLPGYSVRWEVSNAATSDVLTSPSIDLVALAPGVVTIDAYVSRGNSCTIKISRSVEVEAACAIDEPQIYHPDRAAPNEPFFLYAYSGLTVTFAVHGAELVQSDSFFVQVIPPATGSFSIDVIVSNGTCSRTFTRTFEVLPCNPTATVSAETSGSCGPTTIVAEFTGEAPFQALWSDGHFTLTFDGNRVERTVTEHGTYSIVWFRDRYCTGTSSGSATVGASLPAPEFAIEPMVDGWWYDNDTCPGMVRTASLLTPIPAGASVEWSIVNGTILSGQGTSTIEFSGTAPGWSPLSAVFRTEDGCASPVTTNEYVLTHGMPDATITVEPAVIPAGGTAIVTVVTNEFVRGWGLESSLGDTIAFLDSNNLTSTWEYRSSHGGGVATITATMTNACNVTNAAMATLTIDGSTSVAAKATVRAIGQNCDAAAYAEFTGTAPFSGTWSNGVTFTTNDAYALLYPQTGGSYTIVEFRDANGDGTVTGSADFDFVGLPAPVVSFDSPLACPGTLVTASIDSVIPEGASAEWSVWGATIVSGQGTNSVQLEVGEWGASVNVRITGASACSPWGYGYVPTAGPVTNPIFILDPVVTGQVTYFNVYLDPYTETWGFENTLGDAMEVVYENLPYATVKYTSTHGEGTSDIRIFGTTVCGTPFETTHTLQILAPAPHARLTWGTNIAEECGGWVKVTFEGGVAPYSGTWNDGLTFTTSEPSITRFVAQSGTYYLTRFVDGSGRSGSSNWATNVYAKPLPYAGFNVVTDVCIGTQATATIPDPVAGLEIVWSIEGTNASIVSGQGTPAVTFEASEAGEFFLLARYRSTLGCEGSNSGAVMTAQSCNP